MLHGAAWIFFENWGLAGRRFVLGGAALNKLVWGFGRGWVCVLVAAVLPLAIVGCGKSSAPAEADSSSSSSSSSSSAAAADADVPSGYTSLVSLDTGKSLVTQ